MTSEFEIVRIWRGPGQTVRWETEDGARHSRAARKWDWDEGDAPVPSLVFVDGVLRGHCLWCDEVNGQAYFVIKDETGRVTRPAEFETVTGSFAVFSSPWRYRGMSIEEWSEKSKVLAQL